MKNIEPFLFKTSANRLFESEDSNHFFSIVYHDITQEWRFERHLHNNFGEIVFIHEGEMYSIIDSKEYLLKKGDIAIINPLQIHAERVEANSFVKMTTITTQNLSFFNLSDSLLIPHGTHPVFHSYEFYDVINENIYKIISEFKNLKIFGDELCKSIINTVALLLCRVIHLSDNSINHVISSTSLTAQIKDYIENNYSKKITLQDLSNQFFTSTYYINHEMKSKFGFSPIDYLISIRIGTSQQLLIKTKQSISDISQNVGYENPKHFINMFKKRVGCTPTEFREISAFRPLGEK